jgi:iron complex transport system ATP-binding protein
MLSAESLTLSAPGRVLCRELSNVFRAGEFWAVLGANGSGKTTLLHTLCGLRPANAGQVRFDGAALDTLARPAIATKIGLLLQEEESMFWGSTLEYAMLGRFARETWFGEKREAQAAARQALAQSGLATRLDQRFATLSGGERQRARIAQLLVQAPQIYCLDEPLLHLDLKHQLQVLQLFRDLARAAGKCVIMVLHDGLWASRFCDHVLMLYDDGKVLAGASSRLLTRPNLQALYGIDAEVLTLMVAP